MEDEGEDRTSGQADEHLLMAREGSKFLGDIGRRNAKKVSEYLRGIKKPIKENEK